MLASTHRISSLHKEFKKMEEMGARKYPSDFLHREFKKIEAAGTAAGTLQDDRYSKMKRRLTRSAAQAAEQRLDHQGPSKEL